MLTGVIVNDGWISSIKIDKLSQGYRTGGPELVTAPVALCPGGQECTNFYVLIVLILTKNYNNRTWQSAFFAWFAPTAHDSPLLPATRLRRPGCPFRAIPPPLPWITSGTLDRYLDTSKPCGPFLNLIKFPRGLRPPFCYCHINILE